MNRLFFLLTALLLSSLASAQTAATGRLTLSLQTEDGAPLEGATVELLRGTDSALVRTALSDKTGAAELSGLSFGAYLVKATASGHQPAFSATFTLGAETPILSLPALRLRTGAGALQGVTVTGRRPFIQRLSDRIVVNVENSVVSAGSSALDVLERSPGVTIDQNDVVGLRGRQGVIIMIDGKPSPLGAADLANYLRGLPSGAIERIEIITNPSAKYDAAGNSGIIDIRMKKDQRLGTNGTLTGGIGQGVYPKANAGLTFNHRNKQLNLFGNYNYSYRENLNHLILDRNFFDNGAFRGADLKDNYAWMPFNGNNFRLGADLNLGKRTILGAVVNSSINRFRRVGSNSSIVIDLDKQPSSTFNTFSNNNDRFHNIVSNLNLKHTFDSTGRELSADVDYGVFENQALSLNATEYFRLDGSAQRPDYILRGDQLGKLTLLTGKADYTHPLKKGARFEAGLKTSLVTSHNDARFDDMSSGRPVVDVNKTNRFEYEEHNNAAYANFSKELRKFSLQLGLRAEQTHVKTFQEVGSQDTSFSYTRLFPSAFLNYKLKEDHTLGVSVSRRIDRPGYSQLNPFLFLIDVTTYATGNPLLQPQMTWSYELNYTLKNLNFTFGYSRTDAPMNIVIARFGDAFPHIPSDNNVTVQIPVNLESSDYYGLTVSAPVRIRKWWNMVNNANVYYNHFNGNLGGARLNSGAPAADLRTSNTFTFKKGWVAELNANYSSGGQYGYMVSKSQWGLAAGVQKNVLKNKGTLRFNVTDIFWTNLPRATITFQDKYIEYWHAYRESRTANLSFTYRFGNSKVQAARRRATASEEERRRAGGN